MLLQGNGGLLEKMFIRFTVKWLIVKKIEEDNLPNVEFEKVNTAISKAHLLIFFFF